jgi:hypothetical protein
MVAMNDNENAEKANESADSAEAKKLSVWLSELQEKIPMVYGNVAVFSEMLKPEHSDFFDTYATFNNLLIFDVMTVVTVTLGSLFDESNHSQTISLMNLLGFCQKNKEKILASAFGGSSEEKKTDFQKSIDRCKQKLDDPESIRMIDALRKARDKVIAHYDKSIYLNANPMSNFSLGDAIGLATLASEIINEIAKTSKALPPAEPRSGNEGDFRKILLLCERKQGLGL